MRKYEYKQDGASGTGWNPMIPGFIVELGKDGDGKEWLCKIHPTNQMTHMVWTVDFDTNDKYWVDKDPAWETDNNDPEEYSSPFLRPEVVYAKFERYAEMNRLRYSRKIVEYNEIKKTIDEFVQAHDIN